MLTGVKVPSEGFKNEKYKGDLLLGKSFTVAPITHKRLENFGEKNKYYINDHNEPIIQKEIFEQAQNIMAKRSTRRSIEKGTKRENTAENMLLAV